MGILMLALLLFSALRWRPEVVEAESGVRFSSPSGFYDEPFELELRGEGTIYYTLDCTDPDENATLYTGPIHIEDASGRENVYSMNTDVSFDFYEDYRSLSTTFDRFCGYAVPEKPIDKVTVVRAVAIDEYGYKSKVKEGVYFVGFDRKKGYDGFYTMAIVTDPGNLFGDEAGIYVTGKTFTDAVASGEFDKDSIPPNIVLWPANYNQRGKEWEREAYVCCFDDEGRQVISDRFGLRIQGGKSRGFLPKSLNLFARERYGTGAIDSAAIFGDKWMLKGMNLFSGSQDMLTKLKDCLVDTVINGEKGFGMGYRPCVLFLDGEYWGWYWLRPRLKKDYLSSVYNVRSENVALIKGKLLEEGTERDLKGYTAMCDYIADHDMSDPLYYEQACQLIDIRDGIDYYAVEIYTANADWPHNNTVLWKRCNTQSDDKWHWLLWDLNLSMDLKLAKQDTLARAMNSDKLLASLMDNGDFEKALYARLVELANGSFAPARMESFIREYEERMYDQAEKYCERFYGNKKSVNDFVDACERILSFFERRQAYVLSEYGGRIDSAQAQAD